MNQVSNSIKQPQWWAYSGTVWNQLIDLLASPEINQLGVDSLDSVVDINNWISVSGGVSNFNYQLVVAGHKFFVQIIDVEKLERLPSQQFFPCHRIITKNQKLNRWLPHCFYESKELRVFEWLDAEKTNIEIINNKFKSEMVNFLVELHTSTNVLPILDIQQHLKIYYHLAIERNPAQKYLLESIYNRAKQSSKSFTATNNCHNDLSPDNILHRELSNPQLIIVDWEYACISDPLFDIAGISVNFGFNLAQENELIHNYSKRMAIDVNLNKYQELKELYKLMNQLWHA